MIVVNNAAKASISNMMTVMLISVFLIFLCVYTVCKEALQTRYKVFRLPA